MRPLWMTAARQASDGLWASPGPVERTEDKAARTYQGAAHPAPLAEAGSRAPVPRTAGPEEGSNAAAQLDGTTVDGARRRGRRRRRRGGDHAHGRGDTDVHGLPAVHHDLAVPDVHPEARQ